jgi:hypothetical protein
MSNPRKPARAKPGTAKAANGKSATGKSATGKSVTGKSAPGKAIAAKKETARKTVAAEIDAPVLRAEAAAPAPAPAKRETGPTPATPAPARAARPALKPVAAKAKPVAAKPHPEPPAPAPAASLPAKVVKTPQPRLESAVDLIEQSFKAAGQGAVAVNCMLLDFAQLNVNSGFDHVKDLAAARTPLRIMRLQMEFWHDCLETFFSQAQDLRALSGDLVANANEPLRRHLSRTTRAA